MVRIGSRVHVPAFSGRAGVARRDITPPPGIRTRNWGPAETDIADGVHRPLTLTALAVSADPGDDGDAPLVLIAVDGTWWRRVEDERRVRTTVLDGLELTEERLLIALSHTHAGPVLCAGDADLDGGALVPAYLDRLAAAAVEAGREAIGALAPAVLEWTTGRCALAADRELDLGGRAVVGANPAAAADDTVVVGRLTASPSGRMLATVVNYACHPTTLAWQNTLVSPDYAGAIRELVEGATAAPCLFLQGASGELAPAEQYTGDPAVADRHGRALGHAVLGALAGLPPPGTELALTETVESGASLAVWRPAARPETTTTLVARHSVTDLPVRPLPTLAELERQWAGIDPRSRDERLRRARHLRDGYLDGGTTVGHPV
ncbi:hypothetical protein [Jiangella mangrovi]|uniref:Neutral/alkaline non-lysosomal ceramidase N-terminal domain-containing protein n=1 Tax=Jiangella mangrovi TaxID=1524084 RepID=A0A7W9GV58_9ACTN|nr:hypothetical protein [Jiangella mangrovi]MBB5790236.1 hypothetical protein [Jiangella mangrovi]